MEYSFIDFTGAWDYFSTVFLNRISRTLVGTHTSFKDSSKISFLKPMTATKN